MIDILSLLQASIVFGTVILYGALGRSSPRSPAT